MLVLSRKLNEKIMIDGDIVITSSRSTATRSGSASRPPATSPSTAKRSCPSPGTRNADASGARRQRPEPAIRVAARDLVLDSPAADR